MWFYKLDKAVQEVLPAEWHAQIFLNGAPYKESIEAHLFTTQEDGGRYRTDYELALNDSLSTFSIYDLTEEEAKHIVRVGKIITESSWSEEI